MGFDLERSITWALGSYTSDGVSGHTLRGGLMALYTERAQSTSEAVEVFNRWVSTVLHEAWDAGNSAARSPYRPTNPYTSFAIEGTE